MPSVFPTDSTTPMRSLQCLSHLLRLQCRLHKNCMETIVVEYNVRQCISNIAANLAFLFLWMSDISLLHVVKIHMIAEDTTLYRPDIDLSVGVAHEVLVRRLDKLSSVFRIVVPTVTLSIHF